MGGRAGDVAGDDEVREGDALRRLDDDRDEEHSLAVAVINALGDAIRYNAEMDVWGVTGKQVWDCPVLYQFIEAIQESRARNAALNAAEGEG